MKFIRNSVEFGELRDGYKNGKFQVDVSYPTRYPCIVHIYSNDWYDEISFGFEYDIVQEIKRFYDD